MIYKLLTLLIFTFIFIAVPTTFAVEGRAKPENFGGNGKAWVDPAFRYVHFNNEGLTKDWVCQQFTLPVAQPGINSDENSAVKPWADPDKTLVAPIDKEANFAPDCI